MVAGRWLSGRILALFVFREAVTIVAGAGGSANTSSQEWTNYPIEDLRKSECELLGRCEKDYPEQPEVAQPAAKPQTDVVPDEPEEDNEVRLKVKPGCNSLTTVKGIPACPGQEIFFDNFLNPQQKPDRKKWGYEIFMPFQPDYGFVVFDAQPANAFLRNGILNIKPTYAPDDKIRGTLTLPGCTGNTGGGYGNEAECSRVGENHNILPPILSARLTTRNTFTFKYGRVDIVAKLALGDWIVPEIWLEPKKHAYGKKPFQSGRIQIAMARGNRKLQCDKKQYGNHLLETGIFVANVDSVAEKILQKKLTDEYWGDRFHNYSVLWTKDNIEFLVDGEKLGLVKTTNNHPLYHTLFISDVAAKDLKEGETDMAPFDKEFYISLGLSVGGHTVFPDYCKSDDVKKPWKNGESKAAGRFWQSKDTWQKTWSWRGAITNALQVESVKVTAL